MPSILTAFFIGAVLITETGCSGDKSLGGGLPSVDAATADLAEADGGRSAGKCGSRTGIDAAQSSNTGLVAWYRCEGDGASPKSLLDSSARGNDGTLMSSSADSPGHRSVPGRVGNAVELLYAQKGYVALPAGLLSDACEATIATWVYINSNVNAWTRIWDFGQDTNAYMFLTPITNTTGSAKFGISVKGNTHEDVINGEAAVPTLKWTHVAVVLSAEGGTLYFDGAPVGRNFSMSLRPADLGRTVNNYVGRSQFANDPYLDGAIDEIRIYDRALSAAEIQALANEP